MPARLATVAASCGAVGLFAATWWLGLGHYVSEGGIAGAPYAWLYRVSVWLIAAALALLAPGARVLLAGVAFGLAAPAAFVSGAVSCSPGCPLPPFERPTAADLVHAGSTIIALSLCGLVMLVYAVQPHDSPPRRVGRAGLALAAPILGLCAIGLVFVGPGLYTGVMERAALAATSIWLIATAVAQQIPARG
jgi:hypothetical protein